MSINNGARVTAFTLLTLLAVLLCQISETGAKDLNSNNHKVTIDGEGVFQQYCSSCHLSGGNLTVPGKPVAGSKKLSTVAVFKDYLNNPVGHMPYYKNVVTDQTLLNSLYQYCKTLRKESIKQVSHEPQTVNKI